jgi:uncharacterized membrane protein YeiH
MEEQIQQLIEQLFQVLRTILNSTAPPLDQADEALNWFVLFVQWSAIILSALAGLYAARRRGMDFFGSMVIAFVVSLGGGTLRDVLLGRDPVFWLAEPVYAVTVLVIALLSILAGRQAQRSQTMARVAQPIERIADEHSRLFVFVDALALGLWAYLGTIYALQMSISPVVAPIMGVITAAFGGILRDLFFAKVPQSFMPSQLYAAAAAAGAIVYVLLWELGADSTISFLACFVLTFTIRITSVKFNIQSR